MTTPYKCPDCGSPIELHTEAGVETIWFRKHSMDFEEGERPATVAFCTGCEFSVEVRTK